MRVQIVSLCEIVSALQIRSLICNPLGGYSILRRAFAQRRASSRHGTTTGVRSALSLVVISDWHTRHIPNDVLCGIWQVATAVTKETVLTVVMYGLPLIRKVH